MIVCSAGGSGRDHRGRRAGRKPPRGRGDAKFGPSRYTAAREDALPSGGRAGPPFGVTAGPSAEGTPMLAPLLTGAALATCVYCAAANAFFWLCDPQNAGLLP